MIEEGECDAFEDAEEAGDNGIDQREGAVHRVRRRTLRSTYHRYLSNSSGLTAFGHDTTGSFDTKSESIGINEDEPFQALVTNEDAAPGQLRRGNISIFPCSEKWKFHFSTFGKMEFLCCHIWTSSLTTVFSPSLMLVTFASSATCWMGLSNSRKSLQCLL